MNFTTFCVFGISFSFFNGIAIFFSKPPLTHPNYGLTVHQFSSKYGYDLKNQTVITEDGYILTMHRIRGKKTGPPVLLMHGLGGSSADFLAQGPNKSLAFQLADQGYDVWMGNQRGNTWSRQHVMLEADYDASFWDFSFHEIGLYDIPAMVDHIIKETNYSKITYVGSSQGCSAYLAMVSSRPEYNGKILLANVVAPVTTLYRAESRLFRIISLFSFVIEPMLSLINQNEVCASNMLLTSMLRYVCLGPHKIFNWICTEYFLKYIIGASDQFDYDVLPFHFSNYPAGASIKQFIHFIQGAQSGLFSQFDFYNENEKRYNQSTPPLYDISKITAPLAVYYSRGDNLVNIEKLHSEIRKVPNVVVKYKIPYEKFNHLDYVYAKDINDLLHHKLIEIVNAHNKKN